MIPLPGNFSGLFFVHLPTLNFFSQKYTLSQKILHIKCKYKKEYRNSKKEIKMRKKILLLTLTLSAVMLAAGCGKPKTVKEDIVAESEEKDTVSLKISLYGCFSKSGYIC